MTQSKRIWVCIDEQHCCHRQPQKVLDALKRAIARQGVGERLEAIGGGCLGMCGYGPNALVVIGRSRIQYSHVRAGDAEEIVAAHADMDRPIERLRLKRT